MQNNAPGYRQNAFIFSLVIAFSALLGTSSCNNKDTDQNCVSFDSASIQRVWVDPGWTGPSDPNLIVELKFIPTKAASGYDIAVEPMKDAQRPVPIPGGKIDLTTQRDCFSALPSDAQFVDNYMPFTDLAITLASGDLVAFDFVRLTPIQDYPPAVNYQVDVVDLVNGVERIIVSAKTRPCPPYCPTLVLGPEVQKVDSVKK